MHRVDEGYTIRRDQHMLDALSGIREAQEIIDNRLDIVFQKPEVVLDIEDQLHNIKVYQKALLNLLVCGSYSPMTWELRRIMEDRQKYFDERRRIDEI